MLSIKGNLIKELSNLKRLHYLESIDLSENEITDSQSVADLCKELISLKHILIGNNPIKDRYLRQKLIRARTSLGRAQN